MGLLIILTHRIGVIFTFVSSGILLLLPYIFPRDDDQEFVNKLRMLFIWIIRLGLTLLIISGIFRLYVPVPILLIFKLLVVASTLWWAWTQLGKETSVRSDIIFFVLFNIDALFGILL